MSMPVNIIQRQINALASHNPETRTAALHALQSAGQETVDLLIAALSHRDHDIRRGAAYLLGKLSARQAIDPLLHCLLGDDMQDSRYAAYALARIGSPAVEPLLKALYHDNVMIRRFAAAALIRIGDNRCVPHFINLIHDESDEVRRYAARALMDMGTVQTMDALLILLHDIDVEVRRYAADALMYIADERALHPLMFALRDIDPDVREAAAIALGRIGGEATLLPLIATLEDIDGSVCGAAVQALARPGNTDAVEPLLAILADPEREQAWQVVIEALGKLRDRRAVEPLLQHLEDHPDTYQTEIIRALVSIGRDAVKPTIERIYHKSVQIRHIAVQILHQMNTIQAVQPLRICLADDNRSIQVAAVAALETLGTPEARQAVDDWRARMAGDTLSAPAIASGPADFDYADMFRDDFPVIRQYQNNFSLSSAPVAGSIEAILSTIHRPDTPWLIRVRLVKLLGQKGVKRVILPLVSLLGDDDRRVSVAAARALTALGDAGWLALIVCLTGRNEYFYVRRNITEALGQSPVDMSIEILSTTLFDEDRLLQHYAAWALERIGTPEALRAVAYWRGNPVDLLPLAI